MPHNLVFKTPKYASQCEYRIDSIGYNLRHNIEVDLAAAGTLLRARCRYGAESLSPRREGVVAMGILCADSAVATMNDQLRLLIGANASTELYRLALGRRNEGSATCPLALNLPIAIRTHRNVLISAFHNHLTFNSELANLSTA